MRGDGSLYKRGRIFYLDYTGPDGVRHQESSRTSDEKLAGKRLQALRRRVDSGQASTPTERRVTIADLLDDLQTELEVAGAASAATARSHMLPVREVLGELRAGLLTTAMVRRVQKGWQDEQPPKAPATINRRCELLRQAFNLAAKTTPPRVRHAPYIPLLKVDNARQGFISRADFTAVLAAIRKRNADFGDFFEWFYWSSQRPGEIKQLAWPHLDRETWVLRIPPEITKSRTGRSIVVEGPLRVILERRLRRRSPATPLIFHRVSRGVAGQPIDYWDVVWRAACADVGLPAGRFVPGGLVPYDLRRTGLRNIVRATKSERVAMAYSGHKTRATFDRYNIQSDEDQREAMRSTAEYVRSLPTRRKVSQLQQPRHK